MKHKWKLIVLLYLTLVVSSQFYIQLNTAGNHQPIFTIAQSDSSTILYFGDPSVNDDVLDDLNFDEKHLFNPVTHNNLSFSAIIDDAIKLVDSTRSTPIHVIGEGIGGSSAILFSSEYPDKVNSLSLVGAHGVVELELLGGYHLNHTIYGAKHTFYKSVDYLIPHFGMFSKIDERILKSNIQFHSDQRLLRPALTSLSIPVFIQHPETASIPKQVSEEHNRIVPQSSISYYDEKDASLITDLLQFIQSVEEGATIEITEERSVNALLPFDENKTVRAEGLALLILILVIIFSTFISEDLACIGTGLLIARGLIGFFPGTLACLLGIFFGDILLYLAGRWLASSTLHKAPFKWFINEQDIQKSYHWFQAKGPAIIIASRFIPGTRLPTYFSAGAIGASFWMFILYFGVASIIWTPSLVGLSVLLGKQMIAYFELYQEYALWVVIGVLILALLLFKLVIPMFTFKGRRLLYGKIKRLTNWEFWPPYIIYAIVSVYIFSLWIKYKSVTLFTLANPAIPEGGFIKESKLAILDGITARESVAKYCLIPFTFTQEEKVALFNGFIEEHSLHFPVVMKPDIGERGKGVYILQSLDELSTLLTTLDSDYIIQEYIDGEEFGVFYYRYPNKELGEIYSITHKVYLKLVGDGVHTLEELILKDQRAVCLADIHFNQHIDDLYTIPEEGEVIPLVELGTHARGALFFDANHLITKELTSEIDRISKSFEGFYFGRYDIKVPSKEALAKGEHISVIEINGVTSESTNIYDPEHSFFFGIKTLAKQWAIAFEIAEQVRNEYPGLALPSIRHILSLLR